MVTLSPGAVSSQSASLQPTRDLPQECVLLRIFLGEADQWQRRPLYKAILLRARELGIAGATVLRGRMGFGRSMHLHNANILRLSLDLPMIVEIVDTAEKIDSFLPELQTMMQTGLITAERAQIIRYSAGSAGSSNEGAGRGRE
jgi:PII-like signaling protein